MRVLSFILSLLLTGGLIFFLDNPIHLPKKTIAPMGPLLNPFTGFWANGTPTLSTSSNPNWEIPGLKAPAKVVYDDRMVPHIFAQNLEDALFLQGYVTARDRLWQMDISTRKTSGRLSEVLGNQTLEVDRLTRRKGFVRGAEKTVEAWKTQPEFKYLEAYTAGINAFVSQLQWADYPVEFKLLGYQPEFWTPLKSSLFLKQMSETLCSGEDDLEAANALAILGKETFDFLFPEWNPKQSPIIGDQQDWKNFKPKTASEIPPAPQAPVGFTRPPQWEKQPEGVGSNNWAVAPSKTLNGHAILCSDPHLSLTLPSVWYEIQIHTPEMNVYGVSLPGLPGVIIGFNNDIAWGQTNVGQDVLDWYKITWADPAKETYLLDGQPQKVEKVVETIKVKGQPDVVDTVRYTVWGPVVFENKDEPYADLAMQWLALSDPGPSQLKTFLVMNSGKNHADYSTALEYYDYPAQNYAFAARNGDIAQKVAGKFPIKKTNQGRFVQDGSQSQNSWQGFIPRDQIPQWKNPARGFIASANQHSTSPAYPYYYNGGFEDWRGRYLNRRLEEMDSITVEDMMRLQFDMHSLKAEEALPEMLRHLDSTQLSGQEKILANSLRAWDFNYQKDKLEPVYFDIWFQKFYDATWDEIQAAYTRDSLPILWPEAWRMIEILETNPTNRFFDLAETPDKLETAADISTQSFKEMVVEYNKWLTEFTTEVGKRTAKGLDSQPNLASYKNAQIAHVGRLPGFGRALDLGGTNNALNAQTKTHGPSWRMVVEMAEPVRAWAVYPGGQSGNPGSPFYTTGLEKWSKGEYFELLFLQSPDQKDPRIQSVVEVKGGL